ncbi:Metalloendoproteinase 1 [Spatholobus suberectus]|nr:Metalloendoproteinase 1 [Spatholobus suberectus]
MFETLFRVFLLLLVAQPLVAHPRSLRSATHSLQNPQTIQKRDTSEGVTATGARKYLKAFGYTEDNETNLNTTDVSNTHDLKADEKLETSIKKFQEYYHLNVSGKLDSDTIKLMSLPRCGVPDVGTKVTSRFAFIEGKPQWQSSKRHLTYGFEWGAEGAPLGVLRRVSKRRLDNGRARLRSRSRRLGTEPQVRISRSGSSRETTETFEKFGHVLAHAFPLTDGRLHEIGHLLGLDHSSHHRAVMYAYVHAGVNRRKLSADDVASIQGLYSSPEYQSEDSPAGRLLSSSAMLSWFCLHIFCFVL